MLNKVIVSLRFVKYSWAYTLCYNFKDLYSCVHCSQDSNGTNWNPYATLPVDISPAGKAKQEGTTSGPGKFPDATVTQIVVLTVIGCAGVLAIAGKKTVW